MIKEKLKNKEGFVEIENPDGSKEIKKSSELDQLTDPQWSKTFLDYQKEISDIENNFNKEVNKINENNKLNDNQKRIEIRKVRKKRDEAMIPLSEDLKLTRKALNTGYKKNKEIKFRVFSKNDYNCVLKKNKNKDSKNIDDYDLELKSEEQKLEEAKDRYKNFIAVEFQSKYPSVLIDKDKKNELSQLLLDIDNCEEIEDIKKITI